jgi:hypothetical protein
MGILNFFSNKNPNYLKDDELDAARLLQNLTKNFVNGKMDLVSVGVPKLTVGIYHMSFNRTDRDLVPLNLLKSSKAIALKPDLKNYLKIIEQIRIKLEDIIKSEKFQSEISNLQPYQDSVLEILKNAVVEIEKV